jgi:predicted 2-oxoglutarate/Fe(II)-dependent dioxygenase YbiX
MIQLRHAVPADQLARMRSRIERGKFERSDASGHHRLELVKPRSDDADSPGRLLLVALEGNDAFQAAAWPSAIALPDVCRYDAGAGDEDHHEPAFMGMSPPMRRDIAGIVAINDASEYEGGDFLVDVDGVACNWKGRAGDCLLYPPGALCRVAPVREGVLLVARFSVHSAVSDPTERRILFDLTRVLDGLEQTSPNDPLLETLRHGFFDLVRMWTTYPSRRQGRLPAAPRF